MGEFVTRAIDRVDWSDSLSYIREMYGVPAFFGGGILGPPVGPQGAAPVPAAGVGGVAMVAASPAPATTSTFYLGVPVLIHEDHGDGWVTALWPDKENPGRSHKRPKPFTYRKLEWWKLWRDQLREGRPVEVVLSEHPIVLAPKPEPV